MSRYRLASIRKWPFKSSGDEAKGMWEQFGAIILSEPMIGEVEKARGGGWSFFRVHFKILPGQGGLIEKTFRLRVVSAMRAFDPNYAEWQVPVTYRALTVEEKPVPVLPLVKHEVPLERVNVIDEATVPHVASDPLVSSSHLRTRRLRPLHCTLGNLRFETWECPTGRERVFQN